MDCSTFEAKQIQATARALKTLSNMYSPFSLTWLMTNDFQVEFFSYQKQWNLSVRKKSLTK